MRLDDDEVDTCGRSTDAALIDEHGIRAHTVETADEAAPLVEHIDDKNFEIPPAGHGLRRELGPAEHEHHGIGRDQIDEVVRRGVVLDLLRSRPGFGSRFGGGQHLGCEPPDRSCVRLTVHESAAGGYERRGISAERGQCPRRLAHQQRRTFVAGPGDVAKALDRMHDRETTVLSVLVV